MGMPFDVSKCLVYNEVKIDIVPQNGISVVQMNGISADRCTTCSGMMHITTVDEKGYRRVQPCPGAMRMHCIDLYNQAKVPARYAGATFESFNAYTPQLDAIVGELKSSMARFRPGMKGRAFVGPPGTGKTHLMSAIIRKLTLEQGIPCRYVEFSHMISEIRSLYNENQSDTRFLGHLSTVPVLFIDELGKGKCNEFELRIIDELTSKRYNDPSLSTFFASNYRPASMLGNTYNPGMIQDKSYQTMDSLESRVGDRVASRIFEICDFVPLVGRDYRQQFQNRR